MFSFYVTSLRARVQQEEEAQSPHSKFFNQRCSSGQNTGGRLDIPGRQGIGRINVRGNKWIVHRSQLTRNTRELKQLKQGAGTRFKYVCGGLLCKQNLQNKTRNTFLTCLYVQHSWWLSWFVLRLWCGIIMDYAGLSNHDFDQNLSNSTPWNHYCVCETINNHFWYVALYLILLKDPTTTRRCCMLNWSAEMLGEGTCCDTISAGLSFSHGATWCHLLLAI